MEKSDQSKVVRKHLEELLVTHSLTQSISAVDEIMVQYVLGILENLGCQDDLDEEEEVAPFSEMMNAYLPGFSAINIKDLSVWMVDTADKLSQLHITASLKQVRAPLQVKEEMQDSDSLSASSGSSCHSLPSPQPFPFHAQPPVRERRRTVSSSEDDSGVGSERERRLFVVDDVDSQSVDTLRDLCPAASVAELLHCLRVSGGSVQEAACLLLQRQESGMAITVQPASARSNKKKLNHFSKDVIQDDESLKDLIIAKYSFVDTNADKVEHRPELLHKEEKKMIRYREGQVVSTKGERFSEIKKTDTEEEKKTYVSLKPQKKYRFH